jgi:hypothetical protein
MFHARAVHEVNASRYAAVADAVANARNPEDYVPAFGKRAMASMMRTLTTTWTTWGEHPRGSWRGRAHAAGTAVLESIDPEESSLGELPAIASSAEVAYPSRASREETRAHLETLATRGASACRRRMWWNLFACPFTLPLFLTPLSNLPIYWFGWRAYDNWRAVNGAKALRGAMAAADDGGVVVDEERWVEAGKKCDGSAGGAVCCRVKTHALSDAPGVLFVPCDLLNGVEGGVVRVDGEGEAEEDARDEKKELVFDADAAAAFERATGALGVGDLVRRYSNRKPAAAA